MRKSKYTFTYVQNWGITNSRAFEAIIEGCGAFFQEGSELGIFLSDCAEAVSYREDDLISVVGETLKNWGQKPIEATRSSADKTRKIYQFDGCRERYLKLLAVYSSLLPDSKKSKPDLSIKRFPNHSPLRIFYNYDGNPNIYLTSKPISAVRCKKTQIMGRWMPLEESFLYSHIFSRQIVQLQLDDQIKIVKNAGSLASKKLSYLQEYTDHHRSDYLDSACSTYKSLSLRFPSRISAHFNYGRLCAETGQDASAIEVFEKILSDSKLVYHPTDLLFWSEFNPNFFDYENMMFAIRKFWLDNDKSQLNKIENGIRESSLFYLSEQLTKMSETKRALELLRANTNLGTSLPILWFQKFKLSVLGGHNDDAAQIAQSIEQTRPWILALFGEDMIKIAEMKKIKIPVIDQKMKLFLKCFI